MGQPDDIGGIPRKRMLLFSTFYPYGLGETFLEEELRIISEHFDEVVVQPLAGRGLARVASLGGNVRYAPSILPRSRILRLLRAARAIGMNAEVRTLAAKGAVWLRGQRRQTMLQLAAAIGSLGRCSDAVGLSDVVYFYWGNGAAWLAPSLRRRSKARFVVRFHGGDVYDEQADGFFPLRQRILEAADSVSVVSQNGLDYLARRHPETRGKLRLARLGTRDEGEAPLAPEPTKWRVVSCASLTSLKRIVELSTLLGEMKLPIEWHHFGDGPEASRFQEAIRKAPANLDCVWHGHVEHEVLMDFYRTRHVDAFMSISASEGVPVSIMEALSFGIPVLATRAGGTQEVLSSLGCVDLPVEFGKMEFCESLKRVVATGRRREVRRELRQHWDRVANVRRNATAFAREVLLGDSPEPVA